MAAELLKYPGEAKAYTGLVARPEKPNGAAVLIAHGAPGISDHERAVTQRLADLGYLAFAVDYHGADGDVLIGEALTKAVMPVFDDQTILREPMVAAHKALLGLDGVDPARIAVIGYCMGGAAAFELAMTGTDVKVAIGFHSLLPIHSAEECKAIKASVLMLQGARDPYAPAETQARFEKALSEAGIDWTITLYGKAEHAFAMKHAASFGQPGIAYDAQTDDRSWRAMLDALKEAIGG